MSSVEKRGPQSVEDIARGNRNEERALSLLWQLVGEGVFLRARKASKKQNTRQGIDFFGVIANDSSQFSEEIHIPFQVKSSVKGVEAYLKERELDHKNQVVVVVVVNENRTDKSIKDTFKERAGQFLRVKK